MKFDKDHIAMLAGLVDEDDTEDMRFELANKTGERLEEDVKEFSEHVTVMHEGEGRLTKSRIDELAGFPEEFEEPDLSTAEDNSCGLGLPFENEALTEILTDKRQLLIQRGFNALDATEEMGPLAETYLGYRNDPYGEGDLDSEHAQHPGQPRASDDEGDTASSGDWMFSMHATPGYETDLDDDPGERMKKVRDKQEEEHRQSQLGVRGPGAGAYNEAFDRFMDKYTLNEVMDPGEDDVLELEESFISRGATGMSGPRMLGMQALGAIGGGQQQQQLTSYFGLDNACLTPSPTDAAGGFGVNRQHRGAGLGFAGWEQGEVASQKKSGFGEQHDKMMEIAGLSGMPDEKITGFEDDPIAPPTHPVDGDEPVDATMVVVGMEPEVGAVDPAYEKAMTMAGLDGAAPCQAAAAEPEASTWQPGGQIEEPGMQEPIEMDPEDIAEPADDEIMVDMKGFVR